jgi:hypothetical protein
MEEETKKSEDIPVTTDVDIEGGIFNMVITLVHYHLSQGWPKEQVYEKVAGMLEGIANGLRRIN